MLVRAGSKAVDIGSGGSSSGGGSEGGRGRRRSEAMGMVGPDGVRDWIGFLMVCLCLYYYLI